MVCSKAHSVEVCLEAHKKGKRDKQLDVPTVPEACPALPGGRRPSGYRLLKTTRLHPCSPRHPCLRKGQEGKGSPPPKRRNAPPNLLIYFIPYRTKTNCNHLENSEPKSLISASARSTPQAPTAHSLECNSRLCLHFIPP